MPKQPYLVQLHRMCLTTETHGQCSHVEAGDKYALKEFDQHLITKYKNFPLPSPQCPATYIVVTYEPNEV